MTTNELTAAQRKALDKVRAALANPTYAADGCLRTGANTAALHALRAAGLITCARIFLRGNVTADIAIAPAAGR